METSVTTIENDVSLINMLYGNLGKLTKIQDNLYCFVQLNGEVIIFNNSTYTPMEKSYNIVHIGEYVIVLSKVLQNLHIESIILDRKTFKIMHESSKTLSIEYEIIYENSKINYHKDYEPRIIFNIKGEAIGTLNGGDKIEIEYMDSDDYYLESYREYDKSNYTYVLFIYNKKNNTIDIKWESDEWEVVKIGYGLYSFFNTNNYSMMHIYDFIKHKLIS